jgi:hypothetical protein
VKYFANDVIFLNAPSEMMEWITGLTISLCQYSITQIFAAICNAISDSALLSLIIVAIV